MYMSVPHAESVSMSVCVPVCVCVHVSTCVHTRVCVPREVVARAGSRVPEFANLCANTLCNNVSR